MTALLAALAAVCAVLAAWEVAGALDRVRLLAAIGRALAPARSAGRSGQAASDAERRRLALVAAAAAGASGALVGGPAGACAAAVLGPSVAAVAVRTRRRRWRARLDGGAPAALGALADALAAGHGLVGALGVTARDGALDRPAHELLRAAAEAIELGAPVADAFTQVQHRAGPGTWDTAVAALLLQREAGGDLVALLRGLAASADRVARDAAEARAASAQARLTARIVLALPAVACALLVVASPSLAGAMLRRPLPVALLTAAAILQLVALAAVRWITGERPA